MSRGEKFNWVDMVPNIFMNLLLYLEKVNEFIRFQWHSVLEHFKIKIRHILKVR